MTTCTCHFCRTTTPFSEAVESGWTPYFYVGETEVSDPVCPSCTEDRLTISESGELEVI